MEIYINTCNVSTACGLHPYESLESIIPLIKNQNNIKLNNEEIETLEKRNIKININNIVKLKENQRWCRWQV